MNTWIGGGEEEDFPKGNQCAFAQRQGSACGTGGNSSPHRKTYAHATQSMCVSHLGSCENADADS